MKKLSLLALTMCALFAMPEQSSAHSPVVKKHAAAKRRYPTSGTIAGPNGSTLTYSVAGGNTPSTIYIWNSANQLVETASFYQSGTYYYVASLTPALTGYFRVEVVASPTQNYIYFDSL